MNGSEIINIKRYNYRVMPNKVDASTLKGKVLDNKELNLLHREKLHIELNTKNFNCYMQEVSILEVVAA